MKFAIFLLGYRIVSVDKRDIEKVLSRLIKNGLCAKLVGDKIKIPIFDKKAYAAALSGTDHKIEGEFGILPELFRYSKKYGALAAVLIAAFVFVFSSQRVFDIRIRGNEDMSVEEIEAELEDAGLSVGCSFRSLSLNKVESELLSSSDKIGWININRRGTVAYVEIREKHLAEEVRDDGFSNIVATKDCVIEQITVTRGFAAVKVGDTVKRGDLLISGVLPEELGGGFVNAEGIVRGRVYEENTVSVPRRDRVSTLNSDVLSALRIKIFNSSINIFKKYRNYGHEYVIIENNEQLCLFGKYRLPIVIIKDHALSYCEEDVQYTDKELIDLAEAALEELRKNAFLGCEVLMLRTDGRFTEEGYELTDRISAIRDVGEEKYFYN